MGSVNQQFTPTPPSKRVVRLKKAGILYDHDGGLIDMEEDEKTAVIRSDGCPTCFASDMCIMTINFNAV